MVGRRLRPTAFPCGTMLAGSSVSVSFTAAAVHTEHSEWTVYGEVDNFCFFCSTKQ